jgi:SNF2 family DNA or RNA helicase
MPQQEAAMDKMIPTRIGALFMEMGTGKSLTAIALAKHREEKINRVVWFCPVSLKPTVRHEILKHTDCTADDICVFDDKITAQALPQCLWYVVGIESMSASVRVVSAVNSLVTTRTMVIVDESSYIKGHKASRTQRITHIGQRARYRLILTGTPISQGVVDLFSQMRFLSPKILGYQSFYSFAANHLEYHEKFKKMIVRAHNTEYLAAKIKPYVYQVTKDECLDLPDKLYETRYFSMTCEQESWYETIKEEILSEIMDEDWNSTIIFRLFSALQQIVSGFYNQCSGDGRGLHEFYQHRTETLIDVVTSIPAQEKVIIWAKYHYDIEKIHAALVGQFGIDSVALFHGGISEKKRSAQVDLFRSSARFFVATPSCGGHGLTLNESCYVIFYNNGFKYSERLQAEDRCHRIGQEHKVVYVDLVCSDSIDQRIMGALRSKGNVVEDFKAEVDKVKGAKEKIRELIKKL